MKKIIRIGSRLIYFISRFKVFMARTSGYIGIINTSMLLLLVAEKFGLNIKDDIVIYGFIYLGGFLGVLFIGFMDEKLGIFRQEIKIGAEKNQYLISIYNSIEELNKKLDEAKQNGNKDFSKNT